MLEKTADMRGDVKIIDIESLVPQEHLLRKIEKVVDFDQIYGIRSLRQTMSECRMNIVYRWFLHYNLDTKIPHFATVSYAFATRFPELISQQSPGLEGANRARRAERRGAA